MKDKCNQMIAKILTGINQMNSETDVTSEFKDFLSKTCFVKSKSLLAQYLVNVFKIKQKPVTEDGKPPDPNDFN